MDNLNGTSNSDHIILNDDKAPTLNDILSNNNQKNIDDIIANTAEILDSTTSRDLTNPHSNSEKDNLPNVKFNLNETQPLSLKILSKPKEPETSSVIHIPQSIKSEDQKENYGEKFSSRRNTLNEPIYTTINRDLSLIYRKIKFVVNPFISREQKSYHIRQWDLWGPLILNMFLAFTLSFDTKEKSQMTTLIFIIFWLGGLILFLNANFLGVKASIFQMFCLLGYCLFPLNLSAIIVTIFNMNDILRLIIVMLTLFWSIHSSSDYIQALCKPEQKYLVLYPCILFYLYISWFIFSTKSK